VLVIALRATLAATAVTPVAAAAGRAIRFAAWVPPLAALTVGLLPGTAVRTLLGVG